MPLRFGKDEANGEGLLGLTSVERGTQRVNDLDCLKLPPVLGEERAGSPVFATVGVGPPGHRTRR